METERMNKRYRLYQVVEVGAATDFLSRLYDFLSTFIVIANLVISIALTFQQVYTTAGMTLLLLERITVCFFGVDYVLRLMTAKCAHMDLTERRALLKYVFSVMGIIDLLSFLPYFLPVFFPTGAAVFRMFRVVRIFRLFRLNAYYDSINVITEVISSKKQQLLSSVFIIFVLMVAASLCMYSLEHEAQPDVFSNAFSGLWWAVSTLLTVGYGDIYPITILGRTFSIVITFLGVLMVAIPTGIISAGFVEQYSRLKQLGEQNLEHKLNFIQIPLEGKDFWIGKRVKELKLPKGMLVAMIQRGRERMISRDEILLQQGDILILCQDCMNKIQQLDVREVCIGKTHPWVNVAIRDLDISRQTFILVVQRAGSNLIPSGDLVILEGDEVILYTRSKTEVFVY